MILSELRTRTLQALGGRSSGSLTTTLNGWYDERLNSAYRRLCTFQGIVSRPGMSQPQYRVLRFFELEYFVDRPLNNTLTTNFVTPSATQATLFMVTDLYDMTNNRWLLRPSKRRMRRLDPDALGVPREWVPGGSAGTLGYFIYPRPSLSTDAITVREYYYAYPSSLTLDNASPIIPEPWHPAIWMAAAAEGAALIDWPEKAAEYERMFATFIAERKSPVEEASSSGGRRSFTVGT